MEVACFLNYVVLRIRRCATYQWITKRVPEIYIDPIDRSTDRMSKRLKVVGNGGNSLFSKLCGSQNLVTCTGMTKVVLEEDL